MNKIYRLVFNRDLGVMQVASELACSAGGGSAPASLKAPRTRPATALLAMSVLLAMPTAWAVNDPERAAILDGNHTLNPATIALYDQGQIGTWGIIAGYEADARVTIEGGLELDAGGITLGYTKGFLGRMDVVGPGTTLNGGGFSYARGFEVGLRGDGLLNISDGAVATEIQRLRLGVEAGAEGTVNVSGTGSELHASGATVGDGGDGSLNITDGGLATFSNNAASGTTLIAGRGAGTSGSVRVDGAGSRLEADGNHARIGDEGTGSLVVSNGGVVMAQGSQADIHLGFASSGHGSAEISGAGSTLISRNLNVGDAGTGELVVRDGGRIEGSVQDNPIIGWLDVGDAATGTGSVLIEGEGTTADAGGRRTRIGVSGEGELTLRDGASASLADIEVAAGEQSSGSILVTGAGTTLTTGDEDRVDIGTDGAAKFEVLDGATVSVGVLDISSYHDSGANARVSGEGTTLKAAGALLVGGYSNGSLVVEDGASVESGSLLLERTTNNLSGDSGNLQITGDGTSFKTGEFDLSTHFSLTDGAQLVTAGGRVRDTTVEAGEKAVVSGADTRWDNTGDISVRTALDIVDGAQLSTDTLSIGSNSGFQVQVLGPDTLVTTTGNVSIASTNTDEERNALVLGEDAHLQAGGDIRFGSGGLLAIGAGLQADEDNPYAPAQAAGVFNADARLFFTDRAEDGGLLLNHTEDEYVIANAMESENYATTDSPSTDTGIFAVAGTTRLTGDMTRFAEDIEVSGGRLVLDKDINITPADFNSNLSALYNDQALTVTGGELLVNGNIGYLRNGTAFGSGTSKVAVSGTGTLGGDGHIFGAVNVLDGGHLAPGEDGIGTLTIDGELVFGEAAADATAFFDVDVTGAGQSDQVVVNGTANLDAGGAPTTVTVTSLDEGTSYQAEQEYTLLTASEGVAGTFDEVVSKSAFLTPTLTYNANNVMLALALDTSHVDQVVKDGEVLTGNGTWASIDVLSGGTVSPGTTQTPLGTISAAGEIGFAPGSFYDVDISGDGGSDLLTTTGKATLEGGTVRVTALDPETSYQNGQEYTILTAEGGLTGEFADALSRSAFLTPSLSYTDTDTVLTIALATQSNDGVVGDGEILSGNDTYDNIEVQSGGTLSPGDGTTPIGTIGANDNVTFKAGSFYDVDIKGDGSSDLVDSAGTATLEGGTVRVTALDPETSYQDGQEYTILSAEDGITGTFAGALSRSAFITPSLSYTSNEALLKIALSDDSGPGPGPGGPAIFQTVAETRNQYNVAMALNTLPQSGDALALYNRLLMLSAGEARSAFGSLSGEIHASARSGMLDDRFVRDGVGRRLAGDVAGESSEGVSAWVDGSAIGTSLDSDGNGQHSSGQRSGVLAGVDFALNDVLTLGIAAGVEDMERNMRAWQSDADIDARHFGIYANATWGAFSLQGGASHAWFDVDTVRHVQVDARAPDRVSSSYDATATTFFAEGGWTFDLGHTRLTPYLGVAHTRLRTDGTTEEGASTALHVGESKDELLTATAGVRASWEIGGPGGEGTRLTAGLGWQNANGELKPEHRASLVAGGDGFTVYGAPLGRNTGIAELGLSLPLSDTNQVQLGVQGRFGDGQSDAGGHVNWVWRF